MGKEDKDKKEDKMPKEEKKEADPEAKKKKKKKRHTPRNYRLTKGSVPNNSRPVVNDNIDVTVMCSVAKCKQSCLIDHLLHCGQLQCILVVRVPYTSVADPGFSPGGGRQLPKVLLFFNFLPKTA